MPICLTGLVARFSYVVALGALAAGCTAGETTCNAATKPSLLTVERPAEWEGIADATLDVECAEDAQCDIIAQDPELADTWTVAVGNPSYVTEIEISLISETEGRQSTDVYPIEWKAVPDPEPCYEHVRVADIALSSR